jgi:hypothetical protein
MEGVMKVLVATAKTQGQREGDFHWCVEGELVWIAEACALDRADPDGGCGCGRAFAGLNSHRATTTARVAELAEFTPADYAEAIRSSLAEQGWDSGIAEELAADQAELARGWPVGTVVERRLDEFVPRAGVIGERS